MCCSIKLLREGNTPVSDKEIKAPALQLVRKISSYRKPSKVNEEVFDIAMDEIAGVSTKLLANLEYRVRATR
ncbi:MAG: DUF2277 domain-containing protein [SAR202 cluster bacterium]|nr:DUF2277 domain-containing protein [SAR202 cluster bacterium]